MILQQRVGTLAREIFETTGAGAQERERVRDFAGGGLGAEVAARFYLQQAKQAGIVDPTGIGPTFERDGDGLLGHERARDAALLAGELVAQAEKEDGGNDGDIGRDGGGTAGRER